MILWSSIQSAFQAGTQQINALKGKRIRTKEKLSGFRVHDPITNKQDTVDIEKGTIGFIANPLGADILIAFPADQTTVYTSIEELTRRGKFTVVVVNAPTFKKQFEIERS